jgi:hypothetical protein
MARNQYKDIISSQALKVWSREYLGKRQEGDAWSEPAKAPTEWWVGAKAKRVLILAGGDEILLSAVEEFVNRFKVCYNISPEGFGRLYPNLARDANTESQTVVPQTTYVVGYEDTHVSPVYSGTGLGGPQARGLRNWLAANL